MPFKKGQSGNPATQFKKGRSGNPKGLPKGYKTIQRRLHELSCRKIKFKDLNNKTVTSSVTDAIVNALILCLNECCLWYGRLFAVKASFIATLIWVWDFIGSLVRIITGVLSEVKLEVILGNR